MLNNLTKNGMCGNICNLRFRRDINYDKELLLSLTNLENVGFQIAKCVIHVDI